MLDDARPAELLHATGVAIDGRAVLFLGASGAGKSDLALRMISGQFRHGERLVQPVLLADDQVLLDVEGGRLVGRPPASIAGRIEVRGLGILMVPHVPAADLVLAVDLVSPQDVERFPEGCRTLEVRGLRVPRIRLAPFEASAPAKVLLALLGSAG